MIHFWPVEDVLGPVSIVQCTEGFLQNVQMFQINISAALTTYSYSNDLIWLSLNINNKYKSINKPSHLTTSALESLNYLLYIHNTFIITLQFTSKLQSAGDMVAIMEVFVRPPRESCSSLVNLLSLLKRIVSTCNELRSEMLLHMANAACCLLSHGLWPSVIILVCTVCLLLITNQSLLTKRKVTSRDKIST